MTIGEPVMRILEIIAAEPEGVRVTDLATTLKLNRAIPHRLLAELVELGYVVQNAETKRYRATFKLGSLGLRQLETAGILRWSRDELEALAATTRELIRVTIVEGKDLRYLAKAQGANSGLMIDSISGADVDLHATANGKAWLSTLPPDEAEALLLARGLEPKTPYTGTDLRRVIADIARARVLGYAEIHDEMELGVSAIAAPIVPPESPDGRAVAAVSIAGPSARLRPPVLIGFAPALLATARKLAETWHVYEYLAARSAPLGGPGDGRVPSAVLPKGDSPGADLS